MSIRPPSCPWKLLFGINFAYPDFLGRFAHDPNIKSFNPMLMRLWPDPNESADLTPAPLSLLHLFEQLPTDWQPDALIWVDQVMFNSIPTDIGQCPYPTAWVLGDWSNRLPYCLQYASAFDFILSDQKLIQVLQNRGFKNVAHFCSFSFLPYQICQQPQPEYQYDIAFIGTIAPEWRLVRNHYLYRLTKLAPHYRVLIADHIDRYTYPVLLSQCKIVFNWGHNQVVNLRAYEVPACRALLFMEEENLDFPLILPSDAYVAYNKENLEDLLIYYLTHEEERQAIAQRGHQQIQQWSYARQFDYLLTLIPRIIESHQHPRAFFQLPQIQQDIIKSRMLSSLHTPGASQQAFDELKQRYQSAPPAIVNEMAVCLLDMIQHHELAAEDPYRRELANAAQRLLLGVCAQHKDPICLYNLAWTYEVLEEYATAITHYAQLIIQLQQNGYIPFDVPGAFSIPTAKGTFLGSSSSILFLELQNTMLYHEAKSPVLATRNQTYVSIFCWYLWLRIGELERQACHWTEAKHAFEAAIACYAESYLPYFHLFSWSLLTENYEKTLFYALESHARQPLHREFCILMAVLPAKEFTPQALEPLLQDCLDFLSVYHTLPEIKVKLEKQLQLVQLLKLWPLAEQRCYQDFTLHITPYYSAYLSLELSGLCNEKAPELIKQLCLPFSIGFHLIDAECMPQLAIETGFVALPQMGQSAQVKIGLQAPPPHYMRSYNCPTALSQHILGPDHLPYLFPQGVLTANTHIGDLSHPFILGVFSHWEPNTHIQLVQQLVKHSQPAQQVVLWFPESGLELDFGLLETRLTDREQERLLLLTEPLNIEQQYDLIHSATCLCGTPDKSNWFYLWWGLLLGTPSGFWGLTESHQDFLYTLYPLPNNALEQFMIQTEQDLAYMLGHNEEYARWAGTVASHLQAFYQTTAAERLFQLLWAIKLQHFTHNPN